MTSSACFFYSLIGILHFCISETINGQNCFGFGSYKPKSLEINPARSQKVQMLTREFSWWEEEGFLPPQKYQPLQGKSKRKEKYDMKKSKEWRKEPLGTRSYQTSSKRLPPFYLLIVQKNTKVFWHQSEARMAATIWNWSDNYKKLSSGALLAVLYFSLCHIFPPI